MNAPPPSPTVLDRAIAATVVLWGWRRLGVSARAGAATALALAPVYLLPVLFITLPVLIWLLDGITERERPSGRPLLAASRPAFAIGWWFGFGYFLAGLYWVGFALLVDADRYAWALPLAIVALPAGLALFMGFTCALARALWGPGYQRVAALAVSWTILEWARSEILTGFPWNLLGQAFTVSDRLIQPAAYVGDLALSFLAVLIFAAPATLARGAGGVSAMQRFAPTLAGLAVLAALWFAGGARINAHDPGTVPGAALRIVQPNIPQAEKWLPENRSRTISLYLELSDRATSPDATGIEGVTHLIWPETALPLLPNNDREVMAQIAALLPASSHLIMGALRAEPVTGGPDAAYYNSILVVDGDGTITDTYDKRWLVPFGEFLPFQSWFDELGVTQLTGPIGGFTPGHRPADLLSAGAVPRFAPLICYEVIFSERLFNDQSRPGWIINVTNDGWFRDTSGPWQHLVQAKLRAVETGLPVIRAANTGVSAVIDAYGRTLDLIGYGRRGVIDTELPAPLAPTMYSMYRRLPVGVCVMLVLSILIIASVLRRFRTN